MMGSLSTLVVVVVALAITRRVAAARGLIQNVDFYGARSSMRGRVSTDPGTGARSEWQPVEELEEELGRVRRQSGSPPVKHGEHQFNDGNNFAIIHYSGRSSPVILVLTFQFFNGVFRGNSNLYRSTDYGASFTPIEDELDTETNNPSLWSDFYVSPIHPEQVVLYSFNRPKFYYSTDEGATWLSQALSPTSINPRSLVWNPSNDQMALAHDSSNDHLYVTQDFGASWTKISDYVDRPDDYQWGDPAVDVDSSIVYFNTYDPSITRQNYTVSLFTQRAPFNNNTLHEFDPHLGRHDDFLLIGRYIYAQKTDLQSIISLYVSFDRNPFRKAMIPAADPHQSYRVSHIDQQQALVIVEHSSSQFNLYLSDLTGVYYSLSLPDIVTDGPIVDLEVVEGVNGTLVANQYVRGDPSESRTRMRSLISLDNGGYWELVHSPTSEACIPPQCSLHFHMATSAYFRTGIYSQASAPGIILAHGNTGRNLDASNPDLYISRDGGVSWSRTLEGSWGVTVVDHGGLLVAAKDHHFPPSTQLRYSCDEGLSWRSFDFTSTSMTVFGVLTEPGEHTTTVSLYGLKVNTRTWDVVTVNFSSIFPSRCGVNDYYYWHPWDDRTDEECILGSSVTIERRNASHCCLIGQDYSRPIQFNHCPCFEDDFECDYGYEHADGFTGPCIRDDMITLPDPCAANETTYLRSQGYRKIAGDVCSGGEEHLFSAEEALCCDTNNPCQTQCYFSSCQQGPSGSYGCVCWPGYENTAGSTNTCSDVNECASSSPCSGNATCTNSPGSYHCRCNLGYVGDGFTCYSTGDCSGRPGLCDLRATCSVLDRDYVCHCPSGYTGDGLKAGTGCTDINECAQGPCVASAECENYDGGYLCVCPFGSLGDGLVSGSGCSGQGTAGQSTSKPQGQSTSGPPIAMIVISLLLALAVCAVLLLVILLIKKHVEMKRVRPVAAQGIHYRNTEEQQPLTYSNPQNDDDDEPLLT